MLVNQFATGEPPRISLSEDDRVFKTDPIANSYEFMRGRQIWGQRTALQPLVRMAALKTLRHASQEHPELPRGCSEIPENCLGR